MSLKRRKIVEEAFGWVKTVDGFRKTRHKGSAKVSGQVLFCFAAYNLTRWLNLLALTGWGKTIFRGSSSPTPQVAV